MENLNRENKNYRRYIGTIKKIKEGYWAMIYPNGDIFEGILKCNKKLNETLLNKGVGKYIGDFSKINLKIKKPYI